MLKSTFTFALIYALIIGTFNPLSAQKYKPYTLAAAANGSITETESCVKNNLESNGFEVLGSYKPVDDPKRRVIIYTSDDIKDAVNKIGGLTGFALAWRVGITDEDGQINVSYVTPEYWGNAYFREDFSKVKALYTNYKSRIHSALEQCGDSRDIEFGSIEGHDIDKLKNYKYKFGMPKFDATITLNEFDSYEDAVATIDANLSKGIENIENVFSIELADKKIKLYGIGLSGENGEGKFMPKIDLANPHHTAFLPYELLVINNEVHMLHGRYRIALSFPDLKMGQFMKIVSTPGNIKKLLKSTTE